VRQKIPGLYETEKVPVEKKTIYQRYEIKQLDFYWLIAELDEKENLAFGYANLNDDVCAEWGYVSIKELLENGAKLDEEWKLCTYKEAMEKITEERAEVECFRKRYLELLRMLSEKEPKSSVHVLDQLEGIERELYRLGQREWIEKASKRYTI
jgi:hypothetical protein